MASYDSEPRPKGGKTPLILALAAALFGGGVALYEAGQNRGHQDIAEAFGVTPDAPPTLEEQKAQEAQDERLKHMWNTTADGRPVAPEHAFHGNGQ